MHSLTMTAQTPEHAPTSTLTANRFSIGFEMASDFTLDCSIDLCDMSDAHSTSAAAAGAHGSTTQLQMHSPSSATSASAPLRKQNSFEMDDSLGILTPDQMKEFLDSTNMPGSGGPHSDMMLRLSAVQQQHAVRNVDATPSPEELPLDPIDVGQSSHPPFHHLQHPLSAHVLSGQLDGSVLAASAAATAAAGTADDVSPSGALHAMHEQQLSQTDSDSLRNDTMTKSTASKVSNSFITSITSITSLDTGYQGDGELSRPASRGAGAHSPMSGPNSAQHSAGNQPQQPLNNGVARHAQAPKSVSRMSSQEQQQQPQQQQQQHYPQQQPLFMPGMVGAPGLAGQLPLAIVPRPPRIADPMTDSDFFTESDADDAVHRAAAAAAAVGDRRAQVMIDGQLYGAGGAPLDGGDAGGRHGRNGESTTEDSCMESSGIFTDVENRGDDDLGQQRSVELEHDQDDRREDSDDMSPDGSTDTIKSNTTEYNRTAVGAGAGLMTIPDEELMAEEADQVAGGGAGESNFDNIRYFVYDEKPSNFR